MDGKIIEGFNTLGHPARILIVECLFDCMKNFTAIKNMLDTSPATTDYHLKRLITAGLICKNELRIYEITFLGKLMLSSMKLAEVELKIQKHQQGGEKLR